MTGETPSPEPSSGEPKHVVVEKWGNIVQAIGTVAIVVTAAMAIVIEQKIERASEQRQEDNKLVQERSRVDEVRRAAIDRSIALYDYFMTTESTKGLMRIHIDTTRRHWRTRRDESQSTRTQSRRSIAEALVDSISSRRELENVYRMLALMLNDIVPVVRCAKFDDDLWSNGQFPDDEERRMIDELDPPLCDRETFRTILLGPVSEIFFSVRYFFYCEPTLAEPYIFTIRRLEALIADYVYYDNAIRFPNRQSYVFRSDEEKDEVIEKMKMDEGIAKLYPIMSLHPESSQCRQFRQALGRIEKEPRDAGRVDGT